MTVIEDLKLAKAAIEERGWCQGALTNGHEVCAVGALNLACCEKVTIIHDIKISQYYRRAEAYDALKAHLPQEFRSVPDFNDDPSTTKQDVLNLFEKALADLGGLA